MSHIAIRADRVGKSYILGHNTAAADGNNSLREDLTNGVRNFARKTRDTLAGRPVVQGDKVEEFWALKDVSFEIPLHAHPVVAASGQAQVREKDEIGTIVIQL